LVCGSMRIKEQTSQRLVLKKDWSTFFQILITTLHSILNTIGRTYVSTDKINKHALPIIIIE
jgi:hypothetical protein